MSMETFDEIVTNIILWIPLVSYVGGLAYMLWRGM